MTSSTSHCWVCGEPQPDWSTGWLALGDGRHYCPACRKTVYLLRTKWGADIGDDSDDVTTEEVLRGLGVDDNPDERRRGRRRA